MEPGRRHPDRFAAALSRAVDDSGLTLDRIRERLRSKGLDVSLSTLSYWRRGRSRPERPASIRAVRELEAMLNVRPGGLVALLGPKRPRGRWAADRGGVIGFDRLWNLDPERLPEVLGELTCPPPRRVSYLSVHDQQFVDRDGLARRVHTRVVVRAEVPGVDRLHITAAGAPTDREIPRFERVVSGWLGAVRTHDDTGMMNAQIMFGRALRPGETAVVDYILATAPTVPSTFIERRFARSAQNYVLQVVFDPGVAPSACVEYRDDEEHALERTRAPHIVCGDVPPGVTGIRWSW
ncbi:hypothetical protein [Actinokineospora sp. NPDC004072]